MNETSIVKRIQIRASQLGLRLFRMNVAQAWVGERMTAPPVYGPHAIILLNARPIRAGVPGMSDLIGWRPLLITPDMVGSVIAQYTATEVKTAKGRASIEQMAFLNTVREAGGLAILARSESDIELPSSPDLHSTRE